MGDLESVGGKNASLGEMLTSLASEGIPVPPGFATTADAYRAFMESSGLVEPVERLLDEILKVAHNAEVREVFLEVRPSNEKAIALYRKKGFRQIAK